MLKICAVAVLMCVAHGLLLHPVNGQATAPEAFERHSDVIYGRKLGMALTMEVFVPERSNGRGVIWVVSSSGVSSRDQTLQAGFLNRIAPLLKDGYTVFGAIHGSSPRFQVEDFYDDLRRAVRFVRHHSAEWHIDGQRIGIAGSSAGGAIALMIALNPDDGDPGAGDPVERRSSRVEAAACFFPPSDFVDFGGDSEDVVTFLNEKYGVRDPSFQFFDVDSAGVRTPVRGQDEVLARLEAVSPVTYVTPDDPPILLVHGDRDDIVPLQQSQRLLDRLSEAGVTAQLVVREGKGHAWPGWEGDSRLLAEWFHAWLNVLR